VGFFYRKNFSCARTEINHPKKGSSLRCLAGERNDPSLSVKEKEGRSLKETAAKTVVCLSAV
jgi:hypothetical protein